MTAAAVVVATGALVAVRVENRPVHHSPSAPPTTGAPASSTTTTTTAPIVADGTYAVATTTLMVVDSSVAGQAPRQLPTQVWYPAVATAAGAAVDRTGGPYPLLVFSQGFKTVPSSYAVLLRAWASAGFVVAAPTYPYTAPTQATRGDLVHHPTDLKTVIATVLATGSDQQSVLYGAVDPDAVGLVGQSDGGDVSLAVGADSADRDAAVKAMAILSGAEYQRFGGNYFATPTPPLLVVQGSADVINPQSCSEQIYDAAPTPKYYLDLVGATHQAPYTASGEDDGIVARVTTDFFEATLENRQAALTALSTTGTVPGTATVTVGGSLPVATSPCTTTA